MNRFDRLAYLIAQFQKIEPKIVDGDYEVRGTSLRTLADTGAGGYERVVKWVDEKVKELNAKREVEKLKKQIMEQIMEKEKSKTIDIDAVKQIMSECVALMEERNARYGDSWKVLTIPSTANLAEMKLHRIANLPAGAPKTEDEFRDVINYCVMGLLKLKI